MRHGQYGRSGAGASSVGPVARDIEASVRERLIRVLGPASARAAWPADGALPAGDGAGAGAGAGAEAARAGAPAGLISPAEALHPGRRGLRALAVVGVLAVLVAGLLAWRARPTAEPVPPGLPEAPVPSTIHSGQPSIVVAVAGRVRRPGLVRLPAGARVADAIDAAGGVQPGTDLSFVNLARKVSDGELILIGIAPPAGAAAVDSGSTGAGGGPVNLNTATLAQLDTLPGVGPTLAQRIIDYRGKHGGFRSVEELRQVDGIGDARFADLKDLVTV